MEEAVKTTQSTVGNIADHVIVQNVALQALRNTSKLHADSILESQRTHNDLDKKIRKQMIEMKDMVPLPLKPKTALSARALSARKPKSSGRSRTDIDALVVDSDAPLDTDVSKRLHEAMDLLHSQKLEAVEVDNLHDELHTNKKYNGEQLDHEAVEDLLEELSGRVNELEDCIRIQDVVNGTMSKEIEGNIVESKHTINAVHVRIDSLDMKLGSVLDEVKRSNNIMKVMDKQQKRMDAAIEVLNKSVISLHIRPKSGFINSEESMRGLSATSRPLSKKSNASGGVNGTTEDGIAQDEGDDYGLDTEDTDVLAELYEHGINDQPALDAELHERFRMLEEKQSELGMYSACVYSVYGYGIVFV